MLDSYFPLIQSDEGYAAYTQPLLVIVRNDTTLPVVAYAITWTVHYKDGRVESRQSVTVNRPLMGYAGTEYLIPDGIRLISPMFNVNPVEYKHYRSTTQGFSPVPAELHWPVVASAEPVVDGVVYSDGTFIGPDKTRVLERYVMGRYAVRDEAIATLQYMQSLKEPPALMAAPLDKMFDAQDKFGMRAFEQIHQRLMAMYAKSRGDSASDFEWIVKRQGPAALEKTLVKSYGSGDGRPSAFDPVYETLSARDPRVFGTAPLNPNLH